MEQPKCYTCEFYDLEFDELTNETEEWCDKGHDGLKGFPFVNQPKCYKHCTWKED